jgi:hypothetical protein
VIWADTMPPTSGTAAHAGVAVSVGITPDRCSTIRRATVLDVRKWVRV